MDRRAQLHDELKGLVPIKLDEKTTIYVKPGRDVEKIKAKYKNRKIDGNRAYLSEYESARPPRIRARRDI